MTLSSHPKTSRHPGSLFSPDFLWMEITGRCNLRCIHCYAEAVPDQSTELPTHVLTRVLDQAAAFGYKRVQFTGGECTLRDDLPLLITHAKTKGFEFIEVFTNGTLLSEPVIAFLAREGVRVALSLHSYRAAVHDAITRGAGSFDRAMRNLEYLLAYKVPVRCTTIAMKENEEDVGATAYFLKKLGVFTSTADTIRPTVEGAIWTGGPRNMAASRRDRSPDFPSAAKATSITGDGTVAGMGKRR